MVTVSKRTTTLIARAAVFSAAALASAWSADAQPNTAKPGVEELDVMVMHGPGMPNMDFMTMPVGVAGETVEGAPYSAEAVTEVVQPLADGNRIVRESRVAVYRDSAGRTRREQGMAILGSFVGPGEASLVQIHDPVSGVSYILDDAKRTAHKMTVPRIALAYGATASAGVHVPAWEMAAPAPASGRQRTMVFSSKSMAMPIEPVVERLGRESMEGVQVEGTRSTVTLPAGQIGNEQPIAIVSERWYSPELKALVLSRQSDPRFGETTYRLTNIVKAEPAPDLFRVPAGYTVVEPGAGGAGGVLMKFDRRERVR